MRVKAGERIGVHLGVVHGRHTFNHPTLRGKGPLGSDTCYDWVTLRISKGEKELLGCLEEPLFEIEVPLSEIGKLLTGGIVLGEAGWSVDQLKKTGLRRGKSKKFRGHKRTCKAYGNYQPPYEDCTCGADQS